MIRRKARQTEAVVVGAGPVGLCTALALADRGLQVEILDEGFSSRGHDGYVNLDRPALSTLRRLGGFDEVLDHGQRIDRIVIHQHGRRRAEFRLAEVTPQNPSIVIVSRDRLDQTLARHVELERLSIQWGRRVTRLEAHQDHCELTVDELENYGSGYSAATVDAMVRRTSEFAAQFVVGADGHGSRVRKAAGIEYLYTGPTETDLVTLVRAKTDAETIDIELSERGADLLWPVGGGLVQMIHRVDGADEAPIGFESNADLSLEEVRVGRATDAYVAQAVERSMALEGVEVEAIVDARVVQFRPRRAREVGRGRVWLTGAAAQLVHPALCTSDNVGLMAAYDLAQYAVAVIHNGRELSALQAYAKRRGEEEERLLGTRAVEGTPLRMIFGGRHTRDLIEPLRSA